jgi:hypothetical protein
MSSIKVKMKDGTIKDFPHVGCPGRKCTKLLHFEGVVAVITDEHFKKTVIPVADIEEITEEPIRNFENVIPAKAGIQARELK